MTVFQYLKKRNIYDVNYINSLFVTSFISSNSLKVHRNVFLKSYISKDLTQDVEELLTLIREEFGLFDLEVLENLFEFVISPEDKIITGAVYTPQNIRTYMIDRAFNGIDVDNSFSIADISCGCGCFLIDAAKYIKKVTNFTYKYIYRHFIYGVDIESYAVERAKIMLSLLALKDGEDEEFSFNVWTGNSLNFAFGEKIPNFKGFNIVIGNPPYVCSRNIDDNSKTYLKNWSVSSTGHPDLYIPFFQIGYENLCKDGRLCYITMNSFFKSLNGRGLRQYIKSQKIDLSIKDFRSAQIFKSKSTYTCICLMKKGESNYITYSVNDGINLKKDYYHNIIDYSRLDAMKGWNLYDTSFCTKVENVGIPLGKYCKSSHGLATLCNSIYIFDPLQDDEKYYYREYEGKIYKIEKIICKKAVNSNKVNDSNSFNSLVHTIIYPYYECGNIISEEEFSSIAPNAYNFLSLNKDRLLQRDKGKQDQYPTWYSFGRTQGLKLPSAKLFFPKFTNRPLSCFLANDPSLLFYNGQAFVDNSLEKLTIVKKIIESKIFWNYIQKTSKPYHSDYFSLNGNYIKNFGIPILSEEDKRRLISEEHKNIIDSILTRYYGNYYK